MWTLSVSKPKQRLADPCWCSPRLSVLQLTAGETKQIYRMSDVLTRSWEGIEPWVIEKIQHTREDLSANRRDKHQVDAVEVLKTEGGYHWNGAGEHIPVCTCVWTSASLNRMNQWLENRPAFCRVKDLLLLLSQTTRRCGRRRLSWWTKNKKNKIKMLPSYHTISQTSTDAPKQIVLEAFSDNRAGH